jgi:glucose/arabinose dehydrogenase
MGRAALAAVALAVALAYGGEAAPGDPELALIGTFSSPTYLTTPPGDAERLFVVEQGGRVRVVRNGVALPTAFLDLTSLVLSGGERGLLSMAFAPDYAASGRFYVYYTARNPVGEVTIAEYRRSANPDVADATTARLVLTIPHSSFANHNGGQLQFGRTATSTSAPATAAVEEIRTATARTWARCSGRSFGSTRQARRTPFRETTRSSVSPARGEIWSYGLRNPWRSRSTGRRGIS